MKAISGIFLAVLVVLIAISLALLAYFFFYKTFAATANAEEEPINTTLSKLSTGLEIEAAAGNTFYMRNTGTSDLKNFLVYVNGNPVSFNINPSVLPPQGVATITLSDCTPQSDVDINVVGPGVKAYHLAHDMAACGGAVFFTFLNPFNNPLNNTAVNTGTLISFGAQWSDSVTLSMYVNSSSTNGGGWTNGTWQNFGPGNWSNFTVTFPSQIGSNLTVMIYANDTSGNQSVSGTWFWYNTTPASDVTPPMWSNPQSFTPSTYSPTNSEFNITWTDNVAISKVLIETNFSGIPTNYSMTNLYGGNVYTFRGILSAGTFYWESYANDTSNNWNTSSTQTFTISKATPSLSVTLSPSSSVNYPTSTTASCSRTSGDSSLTLTLYRNGALVASGASSPQSETITLAAGVYNYTCAISATQNYTSVSSLNNYLTVNKGSSSVYLYVNDSRANRAVSQNSIVNYTAQLATPATGNVELWTNYSNGVYKQWKTGASPLTNLTNMTTLGTWIWTANFTGNQNYSSSSETWYVNFIIPDTTPPTYSLNSTNSTSPGKPVQFNIYWTDNTQVDNAITSLWNGSSWVNASSWCSIGALSGWCNQTMVVNSVPQQLWWKVYANDTSNNWNTSQNFSLITIPTSSCDFNIFSANMTYTITQSNKIYCVAENANLNKKNAINFSLGVQNSTLDCQRYNIDGNDSGSSSSSGVYLTGGSTKNNTIKNCKISNFENGIFLNSGPNNNTIDSNNVTSSGGSFAIYLESSSSNIITNNIVNDNYYGIWLDTSSNSNIITNNIANENYGDAGIWLSFSSNSNILTNNTANSNFFGGGISIASDSSNNILTNNTLENNVYGISTFYTGTASYNSVTGGSIFNNSYDYYVSGERNNFTNTNFTSARAILFTDASTWFVYQNSSNIWLQTKVSAFAILTRKLIRWSNTLMQWNDTSDTAVTARYNVTGLLTNTNYNVYNNSVAILGSPFNSSSAGKISFTINLPVNKELNITVKT